MIPYQTYAIAKYRIEDSLVRAKRRRLRRADATGAYGTGVIDALGHGLIAIGSRLVADPAAHPAHPSDRRAA